MASRSSVLATTSPRWLKVAILMAAVLHALGAGCKSSEGEGGDQATTKVRFWHTFNADEARTINALLKDFEAQHAGVEVEVTVLSFGSARNRLRAAMKAGEGPDLVRAEVAWIPELADAGLLAPFDGLKLDDHLPQVRPFVTWEGRTWATPQGVDGLVLYYNKAMFEAAGVAAPPQTWESLLSTARRLTVDGEGRSAGQEGFDPGSVERHGLHLKADGYYFLPILWGFGGQTVDPTTKRALIGGEGGVKAAEYLHRLRIVENVTPPKLDFSNEYRTEVGHFGEGRVAMILNGPWAAKDILRGTAYKSPENLGIAPIPLGEGGRGGTPIGGHGYVISAQSPHQEAARALAEHLSSLDAQVRVAQHNHLLPTRVAAYDHPKIRGDRLLVAFRKGLERSHPRAIFPSMAKLFDSLTPAIQRLLRGESPPDKLMEGVAREWQAILD